MCIRFRDSKTTWPSDAWRYRLNCLVSIAIILMLTSAQAISAVESDNSYRLGPDDTVVVTVLDHPEFSGEFFIPKDGKITVPGVGDVTVKNQTLQEVTKSVKTGLLKKLRQPEVFVSLKTARPIIVHVLGSVSKPGPYTLKPKWRIAEAISSAGGLQLGVENSDCTVKLLRESLDTEQSYSLEKAMHGVDSDNIILQAGDILKIESPEFIPVYVTGSVKSPGLYQIRKDSAGLLNAVTMAGGAADSSDLKKVTVTHLNGNLETTNILSAIQTGKQDDLPKLQASDLITVPESNDRIAVMGWVASPGLYSLKEGQPTTLSDMLGMARGVDNKRSGLSRVSVLRSVNGKQERLTYNFTKFLKNEDTSQNPEMQPGDIVWVPQTNSPDWERMLSTVTGLASLIWMSSNFGR